MANIAIVYDSKTGNVKALAEAVAEGVRTAGQSARLFSVVEARPEDLLDADGIIAGSYTSYGTLSGDLKSFFDETAKIHGKLAGKAGGAFASSGGFGGGTETTVLAIIQILLVHGLVVPGAAQSPHYGAVAIGVPDDKALESAFKLGERVARLAAKLS